MSSYTVDDSNTSIVYLPSNHWTLQADPDAVNKTLHLSTFLTGSGTVTYQFEGTQISVFGTIPQGHDWQAPVATYSIDNETPNPGEHLDASPMAQRSRIPFFYSQPLPPGNHTLVIAVTHISDESHPFALDSFVIITSGPSGPPANANPPLPPSDGNGPSLSNSTPSTSPANAISSRKVSPGGIAGIVISLAVVIAAILLFLFHRRRKRQHKEKIRTSVTPFMVAPVMSNLPSSPHPITPLPQTTGHSPKYLPSTSLPDPTRPPPSHSLPIDSSPAILEEELPPPFVPGSSSDLGRHGSMYKPRRSIESLPPTEYGYGGGMMMTRDWSNR